MAKTSRPKNQEKTAVVASEEATEVVQPSDEPIEPIAMAEPPKTQTSAQQEVAEEIAEGPAVDDQMSADNSVSMDESATEDPPDTPQKSRQVEPDSSPRGSGRGFVGMVAGGVIAAALGYGAATYFPLQSTPHTAAELVEIRGMVESYGKAIKSLETTAATVTALEQRLAVVESVEPAATTPVDLGPIEAALASLEKRLSVVESLPTGDGAVSNGAVAAELESMKAEIEALKGQGDSAAASMAATAAEAEARLAEAEALAAALKAEAEATAKKALRMAAVGRVAAALDSGQPFETALADLDGVSVPDGLMSMAATGVPTLQKLSDAFPEAARAALEASRRATMGETLTDRLSSFLETATGARSLSPREGSDPDAILSRAEAAVGAGNPAVALTEISALPPEGQEAMAQWIALARSRLDALDAFETLSASISE